MTVSVLELLDDLATRPYLVLAAVVLAVLALAAVAVLMLRTRALRQRLRAVERDVAGAPAAQDATPPSPGTGTAGAVPDRDGPGATSGTAAGAVPGPAALRRTASAPHLGPVVDDETAAAVGGPAQDGSSLGGGAPLWPALTSDAVPRATGSMRTGPVAAADRPAPAGDAAQLAATAALREVALLGRQLELLDGLEQREETPEVLAVLFQLDNLTMRLRRQAESVLVLAGRESGRRSRDPMPVADVVRTASAQVDGYERITVDPGTDAQLSASAVVPAAHLVAELLENALRFSDPATQVDVRIEASDGAGATVSITDAGLGMDDTTLVDARARLDSDAAAAAGGGRIGLAVVGRIARRLGATVRLDSGPRGTTATVHVPARLLAGSGAVRLSPDAVSAPAPGSPSDVVDGVGGSGPTGLDDGKGPGGAAGPFGAWDGFTEPPALPQDEFAPSIAVVDAPLTRRAARAPAATEVPPDPSMPGVGFSPAGGVGSAGGFAPTAVTGSPDPMLVTSPGTGSVPAVTPAAPAPGLAPIEFAPAAGHPSTAPTTGDADGWFVPSGAAPAPGPSGDAGLRDEVLAELGRLSGYSPSRVASSEPAPALERRTATTVVEPLAANRGPSDRDAGTVRSRFAAFQSATGRGRGRQR